MPDHRHIFPTLYYELPLWKSNIARIAGIDEAGRGAWAGPVCAAAVIFRPDAELSGQLQGVRDSKLMTPQARGYWAPRIQAVALGWGVAFASASEIDSLGILPATKLAATRALSALDPQYLLTDYLLFPDLDLPQSALVKGDQVSLSVAAASVLAKTTRDAWMRALDGRIPGYQFSRHKGYGTQVHRLAIEHLGFSSEHRRSFCIH